MHPADRPGPMVFVEDLEEPVLTADDAHHLRRVLRVRPGEPLVVGDGAGRWRTAALAADGDRPEALGPIESAPRPAPEITIGFGLVKGEKADLIVQKLTELGVDRICPFRAERSVVRWDDDRAARAVARWRLVARNAAMQCHRPWLPTVEEVTDFAALATRPDVARADRGGARPSLEHATVLVGPEGGWSPTEREAPLPTVTLGDHVLRSETAAVTAGVLLTALRSEPPEVT